MVLSHMKFRPLVLMMKEYQAMSAQLSNEYDFVIGLTQGSFLEKVIGSLIMIVGGIMSDMQDIMNGRADGETWKRVVVTTLTVSAVVALLGRILPASENIIAAISFLVITDLRTEGSADTLASVAASVLPSI